MNSAVSIVVISVALGAICGLLARLNYLYWSERRAMTPEERAKADEDERTDMQIW